ncbi:MAG: hypothetical protein Q8L55_09630, partial [Phycisphaerales bacterium]|nr:hypothetical protein [Phycisphaerales bacterium]
MTHFKFKRLWSVALALGVASLLAAPASVSAQTRTAQSVGVSTGIGAAYEIVGEITYSYDWNGKPAALAIFDTYFTVSATTGGPTAAQIETAKHNALLENKCNFFNGLALVPRVSTFGGGRSVTCTPISVGPFPALTGWTDVVTGSNTVEIPVEGFIAGESVTTNRTGGSPKYSFTLIEKDAFGFDQTRVLNVVAHLEQYNVGTDTWDEINSQAISQTIADIETGVDFFYSANGGVFGNAIAIPALKTDMNASNILNSGALPGRSTWQMHAAKSNFTGVPFTVSTTSGGSYRVRITGEIKGNSAVATQAFDVSVSLTTVG